MASQRAGDGAKSLPSPPLSPFVHSALEERPLLPAGARGPSWGQAPASTSAAAAQGAPGSRNSDSSHEISSEEQAPSTSSSRQPFMNAAYSRESLYRPMPSRQSTGFDDLAPELMGLSVQAGNNPDSRYSAIRMSRGSELALNEYQDEAPATPPSGSAGTPRSSSMLWQRNSVGSFTQGEMVKASTTEALLWDEKNHEQDDWLHNPDPDDYKGRDMPTGALPVLLSSSRKPVKATFRPFSLRGLTNVFGLVVILGGIIGIFAFWPMATAIEEMRHQVTLAGWNIGGINATGQVPELPNMPSLVDADTPLDARTIRGPTNDRDMVLVFSDEFNEDGRTFWPGDDPFWEAEDLHYWGTVNYEWCDPDAITTRGGNLEITLSEQPIHGLNFRGGLLTSWNKFCFNKDAYIVINASLPGSASAQGLWPGLWTMGNLGRGGYGATNDGTWPYSYDSCDAGTLPNQTYPNATTPAAARTSGDRDYGGSLSYLSGQRLSACTCRGDDHPGPNTGKGRAAPEIDILEAQVDWRGYGTASQSVQFAPFDEAYYWDNSSVGATIYDSSLTYLNDWPGSITQESASAITRMDSTSYDGAGYQTFGYELHAGREDGYVTWTINGRPTWTLHAGGFRPDPATDVGQRLISEEPMYVMMNLFISNKFQATDFARLRFPATFRIDYIRVYQPRGHINVGCDPDDMPTAKYIQDHLIAYTNTNATTWEQAAVFAEGTVEEGRYNWPRNRLWTGGCDTERNGP